MNPSPNGPPQHWQPPPPPPGGNPLAQGPSQAPQAGRAGAPPAFDLAEKPGQQQQQPQPQGGYQQPVMASPVMGAVVGNSPQPVDGGPVVHHHHHHYPAHMAGGPPPNGMHGGLGQPMLLQPAAAFTQYRHDFAIGICSCNDARTKPNWTIMNALFCPYCLVARQLNVVEGKPPSPFHLYCAAALACDLGATLLPLFLYPAAASNLMIPAFCLLNACTRQRIRARLSIEPSAVQDYLVSWCLGCCAAAQQQTELKLAGLNPGAFCEPPPAPDAPRAMLEMR